MTKKKTRKGLIKTAASYGFHLWVIFFLANVLLFYSFNLYTRAANPEPVIPMPSEVPTTVVASTSRSFIGADDPQADTSTPEGITVSLNFSVPGIGSGGGNMVPKHPLRNITVYLYAPDAAVSNRKVPPLYTIKSTVQFDTNKSNSTYTSYVNQAIDLGASVKPGKYQIAFKTEQSFLMLIKDQPDDPGGQLFDIQKDAGDLAPFDHQTVVMGDIAPLDGNNSMDIDDFNNFFNCFGNKQNSDTCSAKYIADLNDDGIVDGLDYNIMILSFQQLVKQGYPPVSITVPPTIPSSVSRLSDISPTAKVDKKTPTPTPVVVAQAANGGPIGGVLFFIFLIIIGAIGFVLYKKNPKVKGLVQGLLHKAPIGTSPKPDAAPSTGSASNAAAAGPSAGATPSAPTEATSNVADPNSPVAGVEAGSTPPVATGAPTGATAASAPSTDQTAPAEGASADPNAAKEYYVKKQEADEAGTGIWLTLTDDNGPLAAHYSVKDVAEGFANIKGEMKTENGKTFLEISEITPVV